MYRTITRFGFTLLCLLVFAGTAYAQQDPPDFELVLNVSDDDTGSRDLTLGLSPTAVDGLGDEDVEGPPSLPPENAFESAISNGGAKFFTDIRNSPDPGVIVDFVVEYQSTNRPITLSWNPSDIPANVQASMVDPFGQVAVADMKTESSLNVDQDGPTLNNINTIEDQLTVRFKTLGPPSPPTGLQGSAAGKSSISLNWNDNADDETDYYVERSEDSGANFSEIDQLGANAESYTDTGLQPGTEYCYRVNAGNALGRSGYTNEVCVTTPFASLSFNPENLTFSVAEGSGPAQKSFTITSDASQPPAITLAEESDASWLALSSTSVASGSSVTATVDVSGLAPNQQYSATVNASAPNHAGAALVINLAVTEVVEVDYTMTMVVTDQESRSAVLEFGTAQEDPSSINVVAPPLLPPAGAFGTFFVGPGDNFYTYYQLGGAESTSWTVKYQASGDDPDFRSIRFTWDSSALPEGGRFTLIDPSVIPATRIDMRMASSHVVEDYNPDGLKQIQIVYSETSLFSFSANKGWNMKSLPLEMLLENANPTYQDIYPGATSAFVFDGGYQPAGLPALGDGFWIRFDEAAQYELEGFDVPTIDLTFGGAGWYMVGPGSCDMPVSAINDPNGIVQANTLYGFDQAYQLSTVLEQGEGYWLRVSGAGTVTLDCAQANAAQLVKAERLLAGLDVRHALTVRDAAGAHQTLYLASEGVAASDLAMPPVPPRGLFDARFAGDTRLMAGPESALSVQSASYPLQIGLSAQATGDAVYVLDEIVDGRVVATHDLKAGHAIEIADADAELAVRKVAGGVDLPQAFALHGNYPNPTVGSTTLSMDLPARAQVEVTLYDLLGRKVMAFPARSMQAGSNQTFALDAGTLPSGLYLYRVRADMDGDSTVRTGRMMVVK